MLLLIKLPSILAILLTKYTNYATVILIVDKNSKVMELGEKNKNVKIDDGLWKEARIAAVRADVDLKTWVAEAMREKLEKDRQCLSLSS